MTYRTTLPKISIVTPSYNQGQYVEWTVRSVLLQRYPNLEYIFMDGGSNDDTVERCQPYMDQFAHFQSARDGGQSDAIANGFSRSTGEIMAYLNSDDLLLPGALNYVVDYFDRHPDVDFIYGHRCIIDEHNKVTGHWILPPHSSYLMKRWDLIPQESCFWRRSLFEKAGNVDNTFRFAMDYDLFVRFMEKGKCRRVNQFLSAFRIHSVSKTSTQLGTIGAEEISRIHQHYKIKLVKHLGRFFQLYVQLRSALYLRRKSSYPGLQPGENFNLNETWAYLLDTNPSVIDPRRL